MPSNTTCPSCGRTFRAAGIGYCDSCGVYTDWTPPKPDAPTKKRPDDGRSEKQVQQAVRLRWELHGWTVCDMSQSRPTQQRVGFPDIVALGGNGEGLVFCEVKSARGRQSEHQREMQELCRIAGVPYMVARHEDDVDDYLERRRKEAA